LIVSQPAEKSLAGKILAVKIDTHAGSITPPPLARMMQMLGQEQLVNEHMAIDPQFKFKTNRGETKGSSLNLFADWAVWEKPDYLSEDRISTARSSIAALSPGREFRSPD